MKNKQILERKNFDNQVCEVFYAEINQSISISKIDYTGATTKEYGVRWESYGMTNEETAKDFARLLERALEIVAELNKNIK